MPDLPSTAMPDAFDRALGQLHGLPGMAQTKPATLRTVPPLGIGGSEVWIIQTYRQQYDRADQDDPNQPPRWTVAIEHVSQAGTVRLVLPSAVADLIARQRETLTSQARRRAARKAAATRKARGYTPPTPPKRQRKER